MWTEISGQGYELSVAVNTDDLNTKIVRSDFDDMHAKKFGHAADTACGDYVLSIGR